MCLLKNQNNSYIGYTTTRLSCRLTYHFYGNSVITQYSIIKHNNSTNQLTFSDIRKILADNTMFIYKKKKQ